MAQKKRNKKYQAPTTSSKAPIAKTSIKQKLMIGFLVFAMILFVLGGVLKSFNATRTTSTKNLSIQNIEAVEPMFRKDSELTFIPKDATIPKQTLNIEIADTPAAIEKGMMFRKSNLENQGMLFKMQKEEPQVFWMKNTHIPLDIIFIDSKKKIVSIQKNAIPYSERQLASNLPAKYVLEVNADYCKKYAINVGDSVEF